MRGRPKKRVCLACLKPLLAGSGRTLYHEDCRPKRGKRQIRKSGEGMPTPSSAEPDTNSANPQIQNSGSPGERAIGAKSDEYLKWLAQWRPPLEVHTKDGRVYTVRFDHLDATLDAIRRGDA